MIVNWWNQTWIEVVCYDVWQYTKLMKKNHTFIYYILVDQLSFSSPEPTLKDLETTMHLGLNTTGFARVVCYSTILLHSHCGLNIHGEAGTPPSFPSLQNGGNWVLGSSEWDAIFTPLYSIWELLPGDLLPAALPKPRNLTLGQLSPVLMKNIWPAAWLQGLDVQPLCF